MEREEQAKKQAPPFDRALKATLPIIPLLLFIITPTLFYKDMTRYQQALSALFSIFNLITLISAFASIYLHIGAREEKIDQLTMEVTKLRHEIESSRESNLLEIGSIRAENFDVKQEQDRLEVMLESTINPTVIFLVQLAKALRGLGDRGVNKTWVIEARKSTVRMLIKFVNVGLIEADEFISHFPKTELNVIEDVIREDLGSNDPARLVWTDLEPWQMALIRYVHPKPTTHKKPPAPPAT